MAGFMKLQVWFGNTAVMDDGTKLPLEEVTPIEPGDAPFTNGEPAWWARYSAPGYMDCADSVGPFATAEQAALECLDMYGEEGFDEPSDDEIECAYMVNAMKDAAKREGEP